MEYNTHCRYSLVLAACLLYAIKYLPFIICGRRGPFLKVLDLPEIPNTAVDLLRNAERLYFRAAPRIDGQCEPESSTSRSLTFRWTAAESSTTTTYRLVGHSISESTQVNMITVNSLTPASLYTFTVWAVGSQGLRSNNITCTDSTSMLQLFLI